MSHPLTEEARRLIHEARLADTPDQLWQALVVPFVDDPDPLEVIADALDASEAQVVELRRLLTESLGWIEGVEPKPAPSFIAAVRTALSAAGTEPAEHPLMQEWLDAQHEPGSRLYGLTWNQALGVGQKPDVVKSNRGEGKR
jgi:hypothetical protein